jgi:hypothetical protein
MANRSRVYLKNVFKQNAVPTEQNFADLIDSYYNPVDDKLHLDNRGLVIGNDYKKENAAENGLLVQGYARVGSLQVDGSMSLGAGATISSFDNEELGNSTTIVPTQNVVKAYADKKANKEGDNNVSFATNSLSVKNYFTFDTAPDGNKAKVKAISTDSAFTEANHETLATQQAIKEALDLKAKLNGDTGVDFGVKILNAQRVETGSLLITQNDYQVINITVNNQLMFGKSHEYPIDKISIDGTFDSAADTTLATQKAVKTYADTKANKAGDRDVSFEANNLTLKGQLGFTTDANSVINKISADINFANAADTTLATQKAVKAYADTKANKVGDRDVSFEVNNLTLKGQLGFTTDANSTINKISADINFANALDTTLATQKAVKAYADTKANKIGDEAVSFTTKNLTVKGQLKFGADTEAIDKISIDADFSNAADTTLATQKAVKSYVDDSITSRALVAGDAEQDFQTANLVVNGQLQFGDDTPIITAIKTEVSTPVSTSALLTESAIVSYVDSKVASSTDPSDARLKTQVQNLSGCLAQVLQLQGVSFEWTSPLMPAGKQFGFIAQQVEEVMPELVHTGDDGYKSIAYLKLIAFLTEALKEQQGQINALSQDLATVLGNT